jgi:hypothetical protein
MTTKNSNEPSNGTKPRLSLRREVLRHLGVRSAIRTGDLVSPPPPTCGVGSGICVGGGASCTDSDPGTTLIVPPGGGRNLI